MRHSKIQLEMAVSTMRLLQQFCLFEIRSNAVSASQILTSATPLNKAPGKMHHISTINKLIPLALIISTGYQQQSSHRLHQVNPNAQHLMQFPG